MCYLHFQRHQVKPSQYGSATDFMNKEASLSWNEFEKIHSSKKAPEQAVYAESLAETPERRASEKPFLMMTVREKTRLMNINYCHDLSAGCATDWLTGAKAAPFNC